MHPHHLHHQSSLQQFSTGASATKVTSALSFILLSPPHPSQGSAELKHWKQPPQPLSARVGYAKWQKEIVFGTGVLQSGKAWIKFEFLNLSAAWP